jgi:hypothetical protein
MRPLACAERAGMMRMPSFAQIRPNCGQRLGAELSITKQAFSQYFREKATPQGDILARAFAKWGITPRYRDTEFTRGAFRRSQGDLRCVAVGPI